MGGVRGSRGNKEGRGEGECMWKKKGQRDCEVPGLKDNGKLVFPSIIFVFKIKVNGILLTNENA